MVKPAQKPAESYELALQELETLLASLENGQLPLEQSIEAYRRGTQLLEYCQSQLADAEQRIKVLENGALRNFQDNEPPQ